MFILQAGFSDTVSSLESARKEYFRHMFNEHHFNIGLPDNLIFSDQFLDILQARLDVGQCLYCERFFPTTDILREHMRKKKHYRINPTNHYYDKYYIINYTVRQTSSFFIEYSTF